MLSAQTVHVYAIVNGAIVAVSAVTVPSAASHLAQEPVNANLVFLSTGLLSAYTLTPSDTAQPQLLAAHSVNLTGIVLTAAYQIAISSDFQYAVVSDGVVYRLLRGGKPLY